MVRTIVEAGEENLQVKGIPVRVQLVLGASTTDVRLRSPGSDHPHQGHYHHGLDHYRQCLDTLLSEARIALLAAIERRLPITGIKIDRAFVLGIDTSERSKKLLGCMIDMGHALDLTVTAEGVETRAQLHVLEAQGCDLAQGFLFAQAMPAPAFMDWCARHRPAVGGPAR